MQTICTSLQTDNHTNTSSLYFYTSYALPGTQRTVSLNCLLLDKHTHPFNGKTNLDFTEARDSERQWHQLGHMQVCTLLRTDNHANTSPLSFLQAGCPSCHPTNSVKALKAIIRQAYLSEFVYTNCIISTAPYYCKYSLVYVTVQMVEVTWM